LLYWYKSTNTDAAAVVRVERARAGTQITCFIGTKIQILTLHAQRAGGGIKN
jgi:hypothetical protein